jgi:hypothetical protein
LDIGYWILDIGFWILDFGYWIGYWILDFSSSSRNEARLSPNASYRVQRRALGIRHAPAAEVVLLGRGLLLGPETAVFSP